MLKHDAFGYEKYMYLCAVFLMPQTFTVFDIHVSPLTKNFHFSHPQTSQRYEKFHHSRCCVSLNVNKRVSGICR